MKPSFTIQDAIPQNLHAKPQAEQLRDAAVQFEAILLMQLTAALNGSSDEDGSSLFGSDAGSGLAQKLFSEQMATVLARSGSFGIADIIYRQIGGDETPAGGGIKGLHEAAAAIKSLRESGPPFDTSPLFDVEASGKTPAASPPASDDGGSEAEIISTFEGDLRANGIDGATGSLMLDGRVLNSTRARVVPGVPVSTFGDAPAAGPAAADTSFQRPLSGRISSTFGTRVHPIDRTAKFHGGIDIAVATGTQVSSAAEGTVTFAGRRGGYGNLVIIDHPDGRQTRYAHLASISVSAGEPVGKGQPIALSGSTGRSTGPHLHFEVRENGRPIDPMTVLSNVLPGNAER